VIIIAIKILARGKIEILIICNLVTTCIGEIINLVTTCIGEMINLVTILTKCIGEIVSKYFFL